MQLVETLAKFQEGKKREKLKDYYQVKNKMYLITIHFPSYIKTVHIFLPLAKWKWKAFKVIYSIFFLCVNFKIQCN